jgi:hypothetical protein
MVNNSSRAGTVFFGKDSVTVGPYEKFRLDSVPSYWTKNLQLVRGITRSRGSGGSAVSISGGEASNG